MHRTDAGVSTRTALLALAGLALASGASGQEKLHFTYLWHLEQPVYWPDQQAAGNDRTERAWESIQRKNGGAAHPENDLAAIFGLSDRVAAYQYRPRDTVNAIRWASKAGAQVSFSGGLIENIQSLGNAGQLGYSSTFYNPFREARNWTTSGGKPRLDIVLFAFHHPLLPLVDDSTVRKSIQLYKQAYSGVWGSWPGLSRGIFPSEMAFSTRLIPAFAAEGITWSFVSAEHISRACADFPVVYGTGGINCDPPNKADQLNPAQGGSGAYYRVQIDRGCSPAEAYPYSLTPRRAAYLDPNTGASSSIIVVPCSQSLGWKDGYSPLGIGEFNNLNTRNNPARPMLVVLAHDGDNAWGGGFSYYMEATPNLVSAAQSSGYTATTVEQYLQDYPVPANDFTHVEDGAWVNADGDFGAPQMLNWFWPLVNAQGQVDIANGWAEDARNWAVITAAQNYVDTAEQISGGGLNLARVLNPDGSTTRAERAWHYFLASLNSGYMYYGAAVDMEVKPTVACNEAIEHASVAIGSAVADATGPSIFIPQRYPWNPGAINFGPLHGYQQKTLSSDFTVWTFAHDVSGIASVTLKYRTDNDGVRGITSVDNDTYAGGPGVSAWTSVPMTSRVFPAGNFFNSPSINFFELPTAIANQYYANINGLTNKLVDYYVEAVDAKGNVKKSPIQHVWVADGAGSGGGGGNNGPTVALSPASPVASQPVTITYNPASRPLAGAGQILIHLGYNNWSSVIAPDAPMTYNAQQQTWSITVTPPSDATEIDFVFNNGSGVWDNNGGADWKYPVSGGQSQPTWNINGSLDTDAIRVFQDRISLWTGLKGDNLYVAMPDAGEGNDHFIFVAGSPGAMVASPWAKAGQVAQWSAFLADENDNGYSGWFDASGTNQAATGTNGGVLEGTLNIRTELGLGVSDPLPPVIYLAAAVYPTSNGTSLLPLYQAGSSLDNDTNLQGAEYVRVRLCELTNTCCPSDVTKDGEVDLADFFAFLNAFDTSDLLADVTGDQQVDLADFFQFLNDFDAGC
jgi:hypothetical protein